MPPTPIERRVDKLEREADDHRRDDQNQFGQLRGDIANLGRDLGKRIDEMAENLQGQIDKFTLDKARAEGRAEGLAEAKKPNPWSLAIVPVIVGALVAALITMGLHDMSAGHTTTVSTTTTATMPATPAPKP